MFILFIILLVVQVFVWLLVGAYTAHCFLCVVENTSAGVDELQMPNELFLDWAWKLGYMTWLSALLLVPAGFVVHFLTQSLPGEEAALSYLIAGPVIVWLLFPLALLSSLMGDSRWVPFRPVLFVLLAQRPRKVAAFYALSALVLLGGATCFYVLLTTGWLPWLLVTSAVAAACLLMYARLLGRLAWVLRGVPLPAPAKAPRKGKRKRVNPYPHLTDPRTIPAEELNRRMKAEGPVVSIPLEGTVDSYDMADDAHLFQAKKRRQPAEEEPRPVPSSSGAERRIRSNPPADAPPVPAVELGEYSVRREPRLPKWPLVVGVFSFPWYPDTLPVSVKLSVCFLLLQGLALLQWLLA